MPDYQHLTRPELLRLALEKDQLTDEARLELDAEIHSRRISPPDIEVFQAESRAAQAEDDRNVRQITASSSHIGEKFFGRKNRTHDAAFESKNLTLPSGFSLSGFRFSLSAAIGLENYLVAPGISVRQTNSTSSRSSTARLGADSSHLDKGDADPHGPSIRGAFRFAPFRVSLKYALDRGYC